MNKILLIIFVFLMFIPSVIFAQGIEKSIAQCTLTAGEFERFECYDTIAKNNNLALKVARENDFTPLGDWDMDVSLNPIDDSLTIVLTVKSYNTKSSGGPIHLILRCKSNKTEAYISWNKDLGSDAFVLTRIGKEKAKTSEWNLSTDNTASFHPRPISFIKNMFGKHKLVAQITPYKDNPITTTFKISRIENAVQQLRKTCNW